jgi:hypothetical protein
MGECGGAKGHLVSCIDGVRVSVKERRGVW